MKKNNTKINLIRKFKRHLTLFFVGTSVILVPIIYLNFIKPKTTEAAWYNDSWQYRKRITIDNTKVSGSSNLTDFPVLINSTFTELTSGAQADGDDILFTDTSGTKLSHEIESYTSSTGELVAWVKIPTLSYNADTTIYMYYGNSLASNQQDATGTWDSNTIAVWHLNETVTDESTGATHTDSTSANNDGTQNNNDDVAGKIANAQSFDGTGDYIDIDAITNDIDTSKGTVTTWVYRTFADTIGSQPRLFLPLINGSNYLGLYYNQYSDVFKFIYTAGGTTDEVNVSPSAIPQNTWTKITVTWDTTADELKAYVNGAQSGSTQTTLGTWSGSFTNATIGADETGADKYWVGYVDNMVVSNVARSADWLATEYNSQNSPSTFYSIGDQEVSGGAIGIWRFDEGTDNTCSGGTNDACDSSANANDAAMTGGTWQPENMCVSGKCMYFDGTDDVATITNDDAIDFDTGLAGQVTFATWVRVNSDGEGNVGEIFDKGANTYLRVTNEGTDGLADLEASLDLATTDATKTVTNGITLNKWHYVVVTYTDDADDEITVYIDGISQGSSTDGVGSPATDANNLLIGGSSAANFNGFIDEFKIYEAERTEAEIRSDFVKGAAKRGGSASFAPDLSALSDGLVGYWKMDETGVDAEGETISDLSGNGNSGTLYGDNGVGDNGTGMDCTTAGKYGTGCDFDGVDDYIEVADNDVLDMGDSNFSVSAWLYTNSYPATTKFLGKGGNTGWRWTKVSGSNTLRFEIYNGTSWVSLLDSSSSYLETDKWINITTVVDKSAKTVSFYKNGTLDQVSTIPDSHNVSLSNSNSFQIGKDAWGTQYHDGKIDEVRIYNRALSPKEVKDLYSFAPDPLLYWKLDENTGTTTVYDDSGNSKNGTLNGSMTASDWVQGQYGGALELDGSNDYISDAYDSDLDFGTGSFTVGAWVKKPPAIAGTENVQVSASDDDAHERADDVNFNSTTEYVQMVEAPENYNRHDGAFRFDSVTIPSGATITSAILSLYPYSTSSDSPDQSIYGEDVTNSVDFTTNADIQNRTKTTANVLWQDTDIGINAFKPSPNISSVIQEIYNNGWASGNAMTLILDSSTSTRTDFWPRSYDYSTGEQAAKLDIEYTVDPTGYLISRQSSGGWETYIDSSGNVCFVIDDDATWGPEDTACTTGTAFDDNEWHYVTFVKDGTNGIYTYVDGVLEASDTSLTATGSISGSSPVLYAGIDTDATTSPFPGSLDDIKIYNYARTPGQIIEDMNAGHPLGGSPVGSQVAYWKFDEMYGTTAQDKTSNNNDLTLSTASWTTSGKINSAWNGDGTNWLSRSDDADLDFSATDDLTITGWIKRSAISTQEYIIYKETGGAGYAVYMDSDGDIVFAIGDAAVAFPEETIGGALSKNYDDGKWHYFAVQKHGTNSIKLYVDGVLIDSDTSLAVTGSLANSSSFYIGNDGLSDNGNEFIGDIDELKVYRAALTQEEILIDMNAGSQAALGGVLGNDEAADLTDGAGNPPIAYWDFNENTGTSTVYDKSGNGYDGTMNGTMTESDWVQGKYGSALDFDGSNDYLGMGVVSGLNFTTGPFTVSSWIYPTDTFAEEILANDNTSDGYGLLVVGGIVRFTTRGTTDEYTDSITTIPTNEWSHITFVYSGSGGSRSIYINGVLDVTESYTGSISSSASGFNIGRRADGGNYFNGRIDEVKIYDYARTPAQIAYDYNRGRPVGWWRLDECTGTTAYDASGNGNNGTITIGATGDNTSEGTCSSGTATEAWNNGTTGKRNASLSFDGTDDYITAADIDFADQMSGSMWVKFDDIGTQKMLTAFTATIEYQLQRQADNEFRIRVDTAGGNPIIDSVTTTSADTWYFVAWTYDGTTLRLYVNGVEESSSTSGSGNIDDNNLNIGIGARNDGTYPFNGQIDDVRIYNYALSPSQIQKIMNESAVSFR